MTALPGGSASGSASGSEGEQRQERRPQPLPGPPPEPRPRPRRTVVTLTALVAVMSISVGGYACVLAVQRQDARDADAVRVVSGIKAMVGSRAFAAALGGVGASSTYHTSSASAVPVTLTARDRHECPPQASACVDLAEKITWLQANDKVSYGPVRIEPGTPGTPHTTATGTFHVASKAGPAYVSSTYHELMPWPVFFAPGGIAFDEGSLTESLPGCVHLTMASAYYYNQHLAIGAEVVIF
jgi:hypothetical protein